MPASPAQPEAPPDELAEEVGDPSIVDGTGEETREETGDEGGALAPDETILRQNIAKLTSSARSLMPEGLEAAIPLPAMADLLAFLRQ